MTKMAVIDATGFGSRLWNRIGECPKGFLKIDGVPIIEQSITKLLGAGIEKIVIGTGFKKEMFDQLAKKYPQIKCVFNKDYETSGSMLTLYLLKDLIEEDFLLLESDMIFEYNVLHRILENQCPDLILGSSFTSSGEEVFIEVNEEKQLLHMSKNKKEMLNIFAELIGITKISFNTFRKMCNFAELTFPRYPNLDYEQALVGIAKEVELEVLKLEQAAWCKVNNEDHWERAIKIVYPIIKLREQSPFQVKRNILLNPGPATTTDTVKFAQIIADICPREKEFGDVMEFVSTELTNFVASSKEYTTILFSGSGTAAVESIISSVVGDNTILVINNGAYGERMCQIAAAYQLRYIEYNSPLGKRIDLEKLEDFIETSHQKISHIAVVHNETTTGLRNRIEEIGDICKKHGIIMIVDAMSSFAAIPIDMRKMNISYLAASSNKNIQGMAGVSFVVANKKELENTDSIKPRNLYLHLLSQYQHFVSTKQMRFTPPVQTIYALQQAIIETKWEGIQNRYARYSKAWEVLIDGIKRIGLKPLIELEDHSKIITAIIEPSHPNYHFNELHDFLYENGFTIYPGKLANLNTFRVANIGDITEKDIHAFVILLEKYIKGL